MKPVYRHVSMQTFDADFDHHESQGAALEILLLGDELDQWRSNGIAERVQRLKNGYNPPVCLHGPIFGFDPAARDSALREIHHRRVMDLFEIAEILDPETVVLHSSYIHRVHKFLPESWISLSVEFFEKILEDLPGDKTRIAVENIFESEPDCLIEMLERIDNPRLGHCFDIGHFTMFQKTYAADRWLSAFKGRLFHFHLHDNFGAEDLHLPPGTAGINYRPLLEVIRATPEPWSVTVECKNAAHNDQAVAWAQVNVPGCHSPAP